MLNCSLFHSLISCSILRLFHFLLAVMRLVVHAFFKCNLNLDVEKSDHIALMNILFAIDTKIKPQSSIQSRIQCPCFLLALLRSSWMFFLPNTRSVNRFNSDFC